MSLSFLPVGGCPARSLSPVAVLALLVAAGCSNGSGGGGDDSVRPPPDTGTVAQDLNGTWAIVLDEPLPAELFGVPVPEPRMFQIVGDQVAFVEYATAGRPRLLTVGDGPNVLVNSVDDRFVTFAAEETGQSDETLRIDAAAGTIEDDQGMTELRGAVRMTLGTQGLELSIERLFRARPVLSSPGSGR